MEYSKFYKTHGHSYDEYEKSHKERFDFLIEDLNLNSLTNKKIADIGCGLGFIYNRLESEIKNNYHGYDGADLIDQPFNYTKVDLDNFSIPEKHKFFDIAFCFETIEHLTNPYICLLETKNLLKNDGILYLSIPNFKTEHNTIYPGLLYPVNNFMYFLEQLAFEILDHRVHSKCFHQEVFTLKNKEWNHSKMIWHKSEEKFRNIPPHISINL